MDVPGAVQAPLPAWIDPPLATLADAAPSGDDWIHEVKFDGYRMLCRIDRTRVEFFSRNQKEWTARLPRLVRAAGQLGMGQAILDGEIVALDEQGSSHFQDLQNILGRGDDRPLVFYVFDVPYLDGFDLRKTPLIERKLLLSSRIGFGRTLRYVDHMEGWGEAFFQQACEFALEGIISKRRQSPYRSGRTLDWLKIKCTQRQEFVIGGYTDPAGTRMGFGALLLGVRGSEGRLTFAGRVGTGFTEPMLADLSKRLRRLERPTSPFSNPPREPGIHWVEPKLVAEVAFSQWTQDRLLRQASFQGLREDKSPLQVIAERPLQTERVARIRPRLTNPDRVLYPEQGITKRRLAQYYESIAERILPHLWRRPLSLVRCPEGHLKPCFYQKHANEGLPRAVHRWNDGLYIDDEAGLISLVQMGVLEIHPWGSRVDSMETPDRITFDLDPAPGVEWEAVVEAANLLRDLLRALDLESFVKTTGGKGLHVVVPFEAGPDWKAVKAFTKAVAEHVSRQDPDRYTATLSKSARVGKIFIDYLRNGRGATAVAAYSTRAKSGAPVAVPIRWEDLTRRESYTVENVPAEDAWPDLFSVRQKLP